MQATPFKCNLCKYDFNYGKNVPLCLSCGHTFCQLCIEETFHRKKIKCADCEFGNFYESPEDIPRNEALIEVMRALKTVAKKGKNKRTKALRLAKAMIVDEIEDDCQGKRELMMEMFEKYEDVNPFPICERFFDGQKCNEKCKFLHVSQESICPNYHENFECPDGRKCEYAHVSKEKFFMNAVTKSVDVEQTAGKNVWLRNNSVEFKSRMAVYDHLITILKNYTNF